MVTTSCQTDYLAVSTTLALLGGVCGGGGAGGSASPLQGGTSPIVVLVVVWGDAVVWPWLGTTTATPPHPAWCGDCTAQCTAMCSAPHRCHFWLPGP